MKKNFILQFKNSLFYLQLLGILLMLCSGFFISYFGITKEFQWITLGMTIIISIPSLWTLFKLIHFPRFFILISILGIFAFFIEILGVITGFPYGQFKYSSMMEPLLWDKVPLSLPFAWIPLVLAAYSFIATSTFIRDHFLVFPYFIKKIFFLFQGALFLVALDLVIDPAAVHFKLWSYAEPGLYFGIPWSNFAGWILSGFIGMFIIDLFLEKFLKLNFQQIKIENLISLRWSTIFMLSFWSSALIFEGIFLPAMIGIILILILFFKGRALKAN